MAQSPGVSQGGTGNSLDLSSTATSGAKGSFSQGAVSFNFGGVQPSGVSVSTWVIVAVAAVAGIFLMRRGK